MHEGTTTCSLPDNNSVIPMTLRMYHEMTNIHPIPITPTTQGPKLNWDNSVDCYQDSRFGPPPPPFDDDHTVKTLFGLDPNS